MSVVTTLPETSRTASEVLKARWQDPLFRQNVLPKVMKAMADARGAMTEAKRKAMSEMAKREWQDPEVRARRSAAISAAKTGKPTKARKPHSEETKRKISEARRRNHQDPEFRQRYHDGYKTRKQRPGTPHSEAAKAVLSAKAVARWADPAKRERFVKARKHVHRP